MSLTELKKKKGFNLIDKSKLKSITAGVRPDCENGELVTINGITFCQHYEATGSDGDSGNNTDYDPCLMDA